MIRTQNLDHETHEIHEKIYKAIRFIVALG
jgi:hypothetical protein